MLFGFYFNNKVHPVNMQGNVFEIMFGMKDIPKKIIPQGAKFLKNFAKIRPRRGRQDSPRFGGRRTPWFPRMWYGR